MPKPIIKDIQVKKRVNPVPIKPVVPVRNFAVEREIAKEVAKDIGPDETIEIYRKKEPSFIKPERNSLIDSVNVKKNKKHRRIILLLVLLLAILFWILYFVTLVKISITPKVTIKTINESITVNSWTDPLVTTIMSFNEEATSNIDNTDAAHKEIEDKIKNRFQYDTPKGYIILPNCKTNIYYENGEKVTGNPNIKITGKVSALILKEESLYSYLNHSLSLKNMSIEDISKLSCELKTDITNYAIGQKSDALSFIISGDIKLESVINIDEVKDQIKGSWKKEAFIYLNGREDIMSYILKIKPINSFPLIPKNINRIQIKIESIL